jgi:hypothetical protein
MRDTFRWPETTGFLDGMADNYRGVEGRVQPVYGKPGIALDRYLAGYLAGCRIRRGW